MSESPPLLAWPVVPLYTSRGPADMIADCRCFAAEELGPVCRQDGMVAKGKPNRKGRELGLGEGIEKISGEPAETRKKEESRKDGEGWLI